MRYRQTAIAGRVLLFGVIAGIAPGRLMASAHLQQSPAAEPIASVTTEGTVLHGAMSVQNGQAEIANNGEVAAEFKAANVALARGGMLEVCASTNVRIARDASLQKTGKADAGLMFSLDRGAFEAHYVPGAYSDVILTPDLRLLVSGPGEASLKLRVSPQGDTCVDNAGANAPYVVASSLMEGGAYRIKPGQRVLFVQGSLSQVVDNEQEPCGCPPATPSPSVAEGKTGGPSSTPADTAFPAAVSEGLAPPPRLSGTPVVPAGEAHAQVSAQLAYQPPAEAAPPAATLPPPPAPPVQAPQPRRGFFGKVGHFFAKVFGAD